MSAPNAAYISSGLTMFFSDLPILPNSRVTGSPFHVKAGWPSSSTPSSTSLASTYWPRPSVKAGGLDVALAEVRAERLVAAEVAQVVQHLVPEARVEQVQHGVLDAADVEVDAARVAGAGRGAGDRLGARPHPVGLVLGVDERRGVRRVEVAQVVPARPGPVGHRVRLAAVAAGAAAVAEVEVDVHPLVRPATAAARARCSRRRGRRSSGCSRAPRAARRAASTSGTPCATPSSSKTIGNGSPQ